MPLPSYRHTLLTDSQTRNQYCVYLRLTDRSIEQSNGPTTKRAIVSRNPFKGSVASVFVGYQLLVLQTANSNAEKKNGRGGATLTLQHLAGGGSGIEMATGLLMAAVAHLLLHDDILIFNPGVCRQLYLRQT
jgi:hypothetical protein